MIVTPRHDWAMLISELRSAGMSYYKIALTIGVSGHRIKRWACGDVEPPHCRGECLIALYEEVCGVSRSRESASHGQPLPRL